MDDSSLRKMVAAACSQILDAQVTPDLLASDAGVK